MLLVGGIAGADVPSKIDRESLVRRHNPSLTSIDPADAFMVGNGSLAFTADITGLQTFEDQYSAFVPLMTQAQWAWHSFPNPHKYRIEDSFVAVDVRGRKQRYPWLESWADAAKPHVAWLRENPHRFSLGRLSLHLVSARGEPASYADLSATRQTLDTWSGTLSSRFVFDGEAVEVETRMHSDLDMLMVTVRSSLLAQRRLGLDLSFPGVAAQLNPNPADWKHPQQHRTTELARTGRDLSLERQLDGTRYYVRASADRDLDIASIGPHALRFTPRMPGDSLTFFVLFSEQPYREALPPFAAARDAVTASWKHYWTSGGAIDFSGSTDPRAAELERRIVLSQYLMALNAAGTLPPQEEGLFSNSWNGKFHLEMHLWHAAHFAVWGRTDLLERSMPWYVQQLPQAKVRARSHGVRGAWWPKMVGPEGRESPSTINPFITWQQPHPIFFAELIYRDRPTRATLERYRELVFETAELLASYPHFDGQRGDYVLGPPIVPAQEVFAPLSTFNPAFELAYFRFGLATAQRWRERLGLDRNPHWDRVLKTLSTVPQSDGLYLPVESAPEFWQQAHSAACSKPAPPACLNRDHPSLLATLGLLPGDGIDRDIMRRTLDRVLEDWDLDQTWGWDFPLMVMTATRLHSPRQAVDLLFHDAPNNRFGVSGMAPRMHLDQDASSPAAAAYRRAAATYFPANGALLLAVGLMAAGWDGENTPLPGFPKDGRWVVRSEGLRSLP